MDQRTWTVKINFHTLAGGSVIFDKCYKVWRTVAIKFWHLWTCELVWGNIWRNDITQFMSGVKELALILCMLWRLQLINQLNRFLALQALVEHLGICIATFGLKVPILLNWVKFRPGIWDGGATSSTGRGAADNSPTLGCFGLAPSRLSKQWGMDILPIFLLRLGSSRLMWIASLASLVTWEGSLSIMLKSLMEGRGWWKSLQCFSMADVVDLECSLTLLPRALEVSPIYEELHPSTLHSQW